MKIAISIWNNSVSNTFDFARKLLLVELENGHEISRLEVPIQAHSLPERLVCLKNRGVNLLICGAISRALACMITSSKIEILPFVTGNIDDVLKAYISGQLSQPRFAMPNCWQGGRCGRGNFKQGWHGRQFRGGRKRM